MAATLSYKLPLMPTEVPPPARSAEWRFHFLLLTAAVLLGSLLQVCGPSWARSIFERVHLDSFPGLTAVLAAFLVSILAHELGHLCAAWFLNYEVLGGAIGPLQFERWRNRAVVRLKAGRWSRCSISAVPREIRNAWRARMLLVVIAGPVMTLLALVISVNIALHQPVPVFILHAQGPPWFPSFWNSCAEVNFFLFILGLVPNSRTASMRNDAALFLALWRNDADARDIFMCHQAIELSLHGNRPAYFSEPLLLQLAAFDGRPHTRLVAARRLFEWAVDSGNIEVAAKWDQAALAASKGCTRALANRTLAESACFDVIFRDDMRSAVHKFAIVDFRELFPPFLTERAWAARLVACDLPHCAPAHIIRAQYHLPLGDSYYNYERMLLDRLHTKALTRTGTAIE